MAIQPKLEARAEQPCVYMPICVTRREWGRANALVPEVFGWLDRQGVPPTGPLFYRYRVVGDEDTEYDLEIGVPVASNMAGDDQIKTGSIPAGTYVTVTQTGHPDGLFDTCSQLEDWAANQGIEWDNQHVDGKEVWGGRYEFFLTNPAVEPDLNKWSVEVAYLVQDNGFDAVPGLSNPAKRALAAAGYERLDELTRVSAPDILKLHGMRPKGIRLIRGAPPKRGQSFAGDS